MWWQGRRGDGSWLTDLLSESTNAGRVQQWIVGVGLAVPLLVYALFCMVQQTAHFFKSRPARLIEVHGSSAVAIEALCLCLSTFLHAHWFWSNHPRLYGYAQLAKVASAIGLICCVGGYAFSLLFR